MCALYFLLVFFCLIVFKICCTCSQPNVGTCQNPGLLSDSTGKSCLGVYNVSSNICGLHSSNLCTETSDNFEMWGSFFSEFVFRSKEMVEQQFDATVYAPQLEGGFPRYQLIILRKQIDSECSYGVGSLRETCCSKELACCVVCDIFFYIVLSCS